MKSVLITGASSGIGAEVAKLFSQKGYTVILTCDRNVDGMQAVLDDVKAMGYPCYGYSCDVSKEQQVLELFDILKKQNILPELIINNAGISLVGLLQDLSEEDWNQIVGVNLSGVYHVCRAAIPHMIGLGHGRIINVSSMWGVVGASCEVAYSATKGGVNAFTKALAKELAPSNIPVNAVAFGCVDTRMNAHLSDEEKKELAADIPAGYFLTAEDAAQVLYTISTLHPYVTGQIITADGGYT